MERRVFFSIDFPILLFCPSELLLMSATRVCKACGARIDAKATVCDLCGAPTDMPSPFYDEELAADPADSTPEVDRQADESRATGQGDAMDDTGVFCNQCGWKNPLGAKFCSACGAKLQEVTLSGSVVAGAATVAASTPVKPRGPKKKPAATTTKVDGDRPAVEGAGLGRQVVIVAGGGILLVVALFLITIVSKQLGNESSTQSAPQAQALDRPQAPPIDADISAEADVLLADIAGLDPAAANLKRRELINLYARNGRLDLAAEEQVRLAESEQTEEQWILAGNLYYDWMERQVPRDQGWYAQQAISAYQQALNLNPENLDVRTDMAIAYLFDPNNPMEAIRQTNIVLEQDSTHIQANFNRGYMLMQIGRFEQAREQFQKVKLLVGDSGDEVFERANQALDVIDDLEQQQQQANPSS